MEERKREIVREEFVTDRGTVTDRKRRGMEERKREIVREEFVTDRGTVTDRKRRGMEERKRDSEGVICNR